ncbi:MAG: hypothetical protein M0P39_09295 [Rhodocyclaceae bacterium]|jgi:hypothetical protein|nr:hypothetical protein [Rhodocyclaceae bacterium]
MRQATLGFAVLIGLLPLAAASAIPAEGLALDDSHLLRPTQDGWEVVSRTNGETQPRLVPALDATSAVAVSGSRIAYVSRTRHGERRQLGCIDYDWVRDRVIARQDTRLLAIEAAPTEQASSVAIDASRVSCRLVGEICTADGTDCHAAAQEVKLGAEARKAGKAKTTKHRARQGKHTSAPRAGTSTKKVRS